MIREDGSHLSRGTNDMMETQLCSLLAGGTLIAAPQQTQVREQTSPGVAKSWRLLSSSMQVDLDGGKSEDSMEVG